jgi:hypothetical protein
MFSVIKFGNFLQKLFNLQSQLLLKGALKRLPLQIFASLLYHHDDFVKKYSNMHCVCVALQQCLEEFEYSDAQFCQWIACVRVDYAEKNFAHYNHNKQFHNASMNNTDIISAINSLHSNYEKASICFIDSCDNYYRDTL